MTAFEFAAAVAPEIDRVTIAVHPIARPAAVELFHAAGLERGGLLVPLLTPLLAGPALAAELHSIARYAPFGEFAAGLDQQVRQGLLIRSGDVVAASPTGRELLVGLRKVQGAAVGELFADHADVVEDLRPLADRALAAATGGVAFALMKPPDTADSAAHGLHDRITALRYHRADAHVTAWEAAGLSADAVQQLDGGPVAEQLEAETNRLAALPYVDFSDAERAAFLAGLTRLARI
ncbi:MAG TPA: hypothetical protein VHX59_13085 [Mycobacteriales bacterium]|nr:hypothetical protein [Mycobacteriales bacterium]